MNSVSKMMIGAAGSPERFGEFLYAPIGEERNGMALSVVSALARLDLDPWREAASLAAMPRPVAADKMAGLILKLPDGTIALSDAEALAARLVALLPSARDAERQRVALSLSPPAKVDPRVIVFVILMAFLLSAQFFIRGRQSSAQADSDGAPTANMVSPSGPAH
jgi:hypothetical protein